MLLIHKWISLGWAPSVPCLDTCNAQKQCFCFTLFGGNLENTTSVLINRIWQETSTINHQCQWFYRFWCEPVIQWSWWTTKVLVLYPCLVLNLPITPPVPVMQFCTVVLSYLFVKPPLVTLLSGTRPLKKKIPWHAPPSANVLNQFHLIIIDVYAYAFPPPVPGGVRSALLCQ